MLKADACTAEEAFELWRLCRVLDRPDLASLALQHTAKGNILQFRTTNIHSLTARDVDHIVSPLVKNNVRILSPLPTVADTSEAGAVPRRHAVQIRLAISSREMLLLLC